MEVRSVTTHGQLEEWLAIWDICIQGDGGHVKYGELNEHLFIPPLFSVGLCRTLAIHPAS
jgi:hypothetical protein